MVHRELYRRNRKRSYDDFDIVSCYESEFYEVSSESTLGNLLKENDSEKINTFIGEYQQEEAEQTNSVNRAIDKLLEEESGGTSLHGQVIRDYEEQSSEPDSIRNAYSETMVVPLRKRATSPARSQPTELQLETTALGFRREDNSSEEPLQLEDKNIVLKRNVVELDVNMDNISLPRQKKRTPFALQSTHLIGNETHETNTPKKIEEPCQDIIKAVSDTVTDQEKQATSTKPKQRFVLSKAPTVKNINAVEDSYEFKYGELFGSLHKSTNKQKRTHNFVKLKGAEMACYKHKPMQHRTQMFTSDIHFQNPDHSNMIYEREFVLDLTESNIYLNTEFRSLFLRLCCGASNVEMAYLVNIKDIILDDIKTEKVYYEVLYRINGERKSIKIQHLEFVIENKGVIHSFICKNEKELSNWIVSILLRQ